MENKHGFQLAIITIILMILGLMILIGLGYMLVFQVGIFKDNLLVEANHPLLISICEGYVDLENYYGYCCVKKTWTFGSESNIKDMELSCDDATDVNFFSGQIRSLDCSGINC